ncbi:uncharacterized protein LOC119579648 [Penaeus monodon]|uniref:uncharacterized protein LOC119579648 n=1 Tax=Penaeus monodon TaxID=6687 RepID=UPI0018A70A94|nr:uncharacterized protein LOC119579648 [Penaeus monodon]
MGPVEYRAVIRFLYMNGRTLQEIFDEMKETYGEDTPSHDVVKHCHRHFSCVRRSVEMAPIPGRPQCATDEDTIHQGETAILEDRRIIVRQLPRLVLDMCQENQKDFFDRLIAQNGIRVHHYDPELRPRQTNGSA